MESKLFIFLLLAAFCIVTRGANNVADFDEHVLGFEFIFHDQYNLMLVLHGDNCFFYELKDSAEGHLQMDHSHLFSDRMKTEMYLVGLTGSHDHDVVKPSTLEAMRLKYGDLLADFHCLNKNVFQLFNPTHDDDDD